MAQAMPVQAMPVPAMPVQAVPVQPGIAQPGMAHAVMAQPAMAQPAMAQPAMAQPAMAQAVPVQNSNPQQMAYPAQQPVIVGSTYVQEQPTVIMIDQSTYLFPINKLFFSNLRSFLDQVVGYEMTGEAWCWVLILLILFWPLAWLPCVMDSCKRPIYANRLPY